jgi:hypothetical protein
MYVAPKAAELRHNCRRLEAASVGQCCRELGAPIERVMARAISYPLCRIQGDRGGC